MAALDQMDFMMHQGEVPGPGQAGSPGFHGLPEHQGCPYFRSQQRHGSSLPPLHFDAGSFHQMPHPLHAGPHPSAASQHPHGQQQQQHQQHQHRAYHHSPQQQTQQTQQQQTQHQPQSQPQTQTQSQQPPPPPPPHLQQLPPLQPPTLPYPQPFAPSHSHPHSHSHHSSSSPYDPVHASGPVWHPSASPASAWSSSPPLHPYPSQPSHPRSAADSHFGGPSRRGGSGNGTGSGTGSGSGAGLVQPHQQFLPPPDHFLFHGYHRAAAAHPHSSIVLPMPPPLSNHRQGQPDQNQPGTPTQPNQASQSSRPANSHSPPIIAMSNERAAPSPTGRGLVLPSLNPNSNQTPPGRQSNSRESNSREPSPPAPAPSLFNRTSAFRFPDDLARTSNRDGGDATSSNAVHTPQLPLPSEYPAMEFARPDGHLSDRSGLPHGSAHPAIPPPNLGPPSLSTSSSRRHQLLARRLGQSDHDSDEDLGSSADEDEQMIRYIDEFGANTSHFRSLMAEDHIRAAQLLRGQVPNKRVASKKALSQLQSVELDSLSETERTCVICYNDFGQTSPEGIIEAPLRLPKCQHVFGDHCIKKWFEESDSCPYCRDKVPSEAAVAPSLRTYQNLFRMRSRMPAGSATLATADDSLLRILAQQERDVARFRARQEAGSEGGGSRPFQPRERRSPPSETMENRRRTRARHSSFHPSYPSGFASGSGSRASISSHTAVTPGFGQQSANRDRAMSGDPRLFYYPHAEPGHPPTDPPPPGSGGFRMGNANMQVSPPNPYGFDMPYAARPPSLYSQPPPMLGVPHFQNPTNSGNNGAPNNAGTEGQMQ